MKRQGLLAGQDASVGRDLHVRLGHGSTLADQIQKPRVELVDHGLKQQALLLGGGPEGGGHVLESTRLGDLGPDANLVHEPVDLGPDEHRADRARDRGGPGHDLVRGQCGVVAARGGHAHQRGHDRDAGLSFVFGDQVMQGVAGRDRAARAVDGQDQGLDPLVLGGGLEPGRGLLHRAGARAEQSASGP